MNSRTKGCTSAKFDLGGQVAVITGGGTGIGRGAALVLADQGADIVLAGRRPEPLQSTAKDIEALGRRALAVPTDVTRPEQCQELVDTTLRELGRLDILVNCAGGAETKPIAQWTEEDWHQVVALNLGSVWFLSRSAAEPMLKQGKGAIAAKAAVNNLTGSMAAAWTRKGVRVNAIAVGAVRAATLLDDVARYGVDPENIGKTNASGRLGEPEEIGYGVLFFASDASAFCSGQTLYMHGGPGPAGI